MSTPRRSDAPSPSADEYAWLQDVLDSFPLDPLPGLDLHDPYVLDTDMDADLLFLSTLDAPDGGSPASQWGAAARELERAVTPGVASSLRSSVHSCRLQAKRPGSSSLGSASERVDEFADAADVLTPLPSEDAASFSSWAPATARRRDTPRFPELRPCPAMASGDRSATSSSTAASRFGSATSSLISECSRLEMLRQLHGERRPRTRRRLF